MAQFGRPNEDITTGWTPSTGSTHFGVIDEVTPDDADYIRATGNQTFECKFSAVTDPVVHTGHVIRIRARATGTGGAERLNTWGLYDGATAIATSNSSITRNTFNEYSISLSEAQAGNITNYADLRVRALSSQGASETIDVAWCEFECPDASSPQEMLPGVGAVSVDGFAPTWAATANVAVTIGVGVLLLAGGEAFFGRVPKILGSTSGETASGTSHTIPLPSGLQAGEHCSVWLVGPSGTSFGTINSPDLWRGSSADNGDSSVGVIIYHRYCDGGENANLIVPTAITCQLSYVTLRIEAGAIPYYHWRRGSGAGGASIPDPHTSSNGNAAHDFTFVNLFGVNGTTLPTTPNAGWEVVDSNTGAGTHSAWVQSVPRRLGVDEDWNIGVQDIAAVQHYQYLLSFHFPNPDGYLKEPHGDGARSYGADQSPMATNNSVVIAATSIERVSQSFKGNGGEIKRMSAWFKKNSTASSDIDVTLKIYAHSGTFGTNSQPTGSELATSNTVNLAALGGNNSNVNTLIEFDFATGFQSGLDTNYCVVAEFTNIVSGHQVGLVRGGSASGTGNRATYDGTVWTSPAVDSSSDWGVIYEYYFLSAGVGALTLTGFEPVWTTGAPSGPFAGTPGFGELTLTGFAPTIQTPRVLLPDVGALTLTGFEPTVQTPRVTLPDVGVLTLTGLEPRVDLIGNTNPALGEITLTGFEPTIQTPRNITPDVGALALTGFAPTWTTAAPPASFNGTPGFGALTLTGLAPTIQTPRVLLPDVGALTLTGFEPTIQTPRVILPDVGALTLIGLEPTLQTPRVILPSVGALTLTGLEPVWTTGAPPASFNGTPGTGEITLAGFAPTIQTPRVVLPDVGVLTLAGLEPTLQTPRVVLPNFGVLTITGFEPTIAAGGNITLSPSTGEITLTGFSPSIQTPRNISVGLGELTLIGFEPTVAVGGNIFLTPSTGEIAINGFVPVASSSGSLVLIPGAGQIIVTGFTPLFGKIRDYSLNSIITRDYSLNSIITPSITKTSRIRNTTLQSDI